MVQPEAAGVRPLAGLPQRVLPGPIHPYRTGNQSPRQCALLPVSQAGTAVLASGGEEGQIKLWKVSNGHCLETFHLSAPRAASIAFNPEGTMLACGSLDGAVEVWQIGREGGNHRIRTLHGHALWVSAVAFGPGNLLVSTSYNGKVRLWNVESGRCLRTFQGYSNVVSALAFSPNGKLLVHGDDNGMLKLWELGEEGGRCVRTLRGHAGSIWLVNLHWGRERADRSAKILPQSPGCGRRIGR